MSFKFADEVAVKMMVWLIMIIRESPELRFRRTGFKSPVSTLWLCDPISVYLSCLTY